MLHELKSIDADKVNPLNPAMHIPNTSIASIIFAVFLLDFQCIDSHMKYNAANIAPINNRMFPIPLTSLRCWYSHPSYLPLLALAFLHSMK